MPSQSLIHDTAWPAAISVVQVIAHLLPEEEQRAVLEEMYTRIKAAIVQYEEKADRMAKRVRPSTN